MKKKLFIVNNNSHRHSHRHSSSSNNNIFMNKEVTSIHTNDISLYFYCSLSSLSIFRVFYSLIHSSLISMRAQVIHLLTTLMVWINNLLLQMNNLLVSAHHNYHPLSSSLSALFFSFLSSSSHALHHLIHMYEVMIVIVSRWPSLLLYWSFNCTYCILHKLF